MIKSIAGFTILSLWLSLASIACAGEIPSCLDVNKFRHGSSPPCAPPEMSDMEATDTIKKLTLERMEYHWYLFASEDWWKTIPVDSRWEILTRCVSSIQSLYGANANVYLALSPDSEVEKRAFVRSGIPRDRIKAVAIYRGPENLFNYTRKRFPKGHHNKAYTLVVY